MTIDTGPKLAISNELQRIEEDCIHSGKAHFNAATRWTSYNLWLGLPSVILSAASGAAFMKDFPDIAAIFATVVSILAALMTFLKPSEKAGMHKASGEQYLALRNDARVFREIKLPHSCDEQAAIDGLDEFTKRRNELNTTSHAFADRDFKKARAGVREGQAKHQVDGGG